MAHQIVLDQVEKWFRSRDPSSPDASVIQKSEDLVNYLEGGSVVLLTRAEFNAAVNQARPAGRKVVLG